MLPLGAQDYVSQAEVFAGDATGEDFVEEDDDEENNGKEESDPAAQRFSRLRSLLGQKRSPLVNSALLQSSRLNVPFPLFFHHFTFPH